jgi:hypothetical protein
VAYTDLSRRPISHAVSVLERHPEEPDAVRREHTRACVALAVAWAGLAVAFGGYAIAERSVGAAVLMLVVLGVLRVSWNGSWPDDDARPADREIRLLP